MYDQNKLRKDFDNQISDLIKEKELRVDDYAERVKICADIREVLVEACYTSCLVYPYGSTINSVGFTDSDLDLYLDLELSKDTTKIAKIVENCLHLLTLKLCPMPGC
jgi:DNA polymerase sigma